MRKPKILNEQGEEIEDYSTYCPKCGTTDIRKGAMSGQDFDENGWYQKQEFICNAPKCGYRWHNRVVLADGGGGFRFQNW
jgi:predicted RNA-binding Zn-ribbon protein involved in translation (DUF1610 family)